MNHEPYQALYIHIPFCKSRCIYCDFYSNAEKQNSPKIRKYLDKLLLDINSLSKRGELSHIKTIYIGGGTPTYLGHAMLTELLYFLSTTLNLGNVEEFSVEANPESVDERLIYDMWALGVNRLSIGVQSFNDKNLELLSRAHNSNQAKQAIETTLKRFNNISIDLMCGLPFQTLEDFESDVLTSLNFDIKHISIYPLTVEKGTPLFRLCKRGKYPFPDDDLQADMMQSAEKILEKHGIYRYEVASYCADGFESKHNVSYWTGIPYIGIGESAATMTQNDERRMRIQNGQVTDDLNKKEMIAEDLMLKMRMKRGINKKEIEDAKKHLDNVQQCFDNLIELGLVQKTGDRYVPTHKGWLCGNELYGDIFDLA